MFLDWIKRKNAELKSKKIADSEAELYKEVDSEMGRTSYVNELDNYYKDTTVTFKELLRQRYEEKV